jgi:hypothetical protein
MISRISRTLLLGLVALLGLGLAGCDSLVEMTAPKEQVEFAKNFVALFQSRDFAAIEAQRDPKLKNAQLRAGFEQIADLFPGEPAKTTTLTAWRTNKNITSGVGTYHLSFRCNFPSPSLAVEVVLQQEREAGGSCGERENRERPEGGRGPLARRVAPAACSWIVAGLLDVSFERNLTSMERIDLSEQRRA